MTPPRQILEGASFEICSRTHSRTFRLLPSREVNNLFMYLLGVAAQRHAVELHGLVVMATHYHLLGNDRDGRLPDFARYFHSLLARALNCYQAKHDKLWSGEGYHLLRPQSAADLEHRMVYIAANPAAAGIVNRAEDFPGIVIGPDDVGRIVHATRPEFFFRESMPASVAFRFEVPAAFKEDSAGYVQRFETALREREWEHRKERRAAGRSVMGAGRCRAAVLGQRSRSYEQWFQLRPTIAAKMKAERMAALQALRAFRDSYREALGVWRSGNHGVTFPVGTWWMCRFAGAAVG